MKAVSRGQALEISARVGTQVAWDELDGEQVQAVVELSPEEFRNRFTAFLRNGARLIVGALMLLINRSKKFNPTEFVGAGWTIWKGPADGTGLEGEEEQDARALALTELDMNKVQLKSSLEAGETSITGEENLNRLTRTGQVRLDAGALVHLWANQHLIPESWKERVNGNIQFIYFDGTVLRYPNGNRDVLYLYWSDGEWYWSVDWLDDDRHAHDLSAVLAS